jgi:hypothetical protein
VPPQGGRKHPQQEFLQVDTRNVLFICGGAFSGLEKVIRERSEKSGIGFGADIKSKSTEIKVGECLRDLEPEDLIKFGLIPEFVGRLPVIATLDELDEAALITILTEPKNALVKQYRKLFELEDVDLEFRDETLRSVAERAMERKTGSRGLRSILEKALLETMFELPSLENVCKVIVDSSVIDEEARPLYVYEDSTITLQTFSNDGSSNIVSSKAFSSIDRKPREPVFLSIARSATERNVSSRNSKSTSSNSKSFRYCLTNAFFGSVSIVINAASSNSSRVAITGNRPTNSGINPNLIRSSGSKSRRHSPTFISVDLLLISAPKPIPDFSERSLITFSKPENAPPQMNRTLRVST